jgi:hypothetical protein
VTAATLLPFTLAGPFTGVALDRWSRRDVLVVAALAGPCSPWAWPACWPGGRPTSCSTVVVVAGFAVNRSARRTVRRPAAQRSEPDSCLQPMPSCRPWAPSLRGRARSRRASPARARDPALVLVAWALGGCRGAWAWASSVRHSAPTAAGARARDVGGGVPSALAGLRAAAGPSGRTAGGRRRDRRGRRPAPVRDPHCLTAGHPALSQQLRLRRRDAARARGVLGGGSRGRHRVRPCRRGGPRAGRALVEPGGGADRAARGGTGPVPVRRHARRGGAGHGRLRAEPGRTGGQDLHGHPCPASGRRRLPRTRLHPVRHGLQRRAGVGDVPRRSAAASERTGARGDGRGRRRPGGDSGSHRPARSDFSSRRPGHPLR